MEICSGHWGGVGGGNAFWSFQSQMARGGGVKTWKPSMVGYGYFLELPNMHWSGETLEHDEGKLSNSRNTYLKNDIAGNID